MPQLLAPYNNAMRLGQGFNSFTQQICIDNAVRPHARDANDDSKINDEPEDNYSIDRGVSQIVTYSSRFVDKLSDVTDSMNIAASLSIKTATIGGKGTGSYFDSDKFVESDMNFFIQVKVINQITKAKDYTDFSPITTNPVPETKFTEVYGDCFISGWEEGGELNALISVKVKDKSQVSKIQASLEVELGKPGLSGSAEGIGEIDKALKNMSTETTISVNWSGGGQIKETNVLWDVNSLQLAASNFPELVARTPQRIYAILTKYSALRSFYEKQKMYSLLDYENANIYTAYLLDAYMDYKSIWRQLTVLNSDLETFQLRIKTAQPSGDVLSYGKSLVEKQKKYYTDRQKEAQDRADGKMAGTVALRSQPGNTKGSDDVGSNTAWTLQKAAKAFKPNVIEYQPYPASIVGLDRAKSDCRLEMKKIVQEVDQVTEDPSVALQPDRNGIFLSPVMFKQLIPVSNHDF